MSDWDRVPSQKVQVINNQHHPNHPKTLNCINNIANLSTRSFQTHIHIFDIKKSSFCSHTHTPINGWYSPRNPSRTVASNIHIPTSAPKYDKPSIVSHSPRLTSLFFSSISFSISSFVAPAGEWICYFSDWLWCHWKPSREPRSRMSSFVHNRGRTLS